jgi:hypothetical protein
MHAFGGLAGCRLWLLTAALGLGLHMYVCTEFLLYVISLICVYVCMCMYVCTEFLLLTAALDLGLYMYVCTEFLLYVYM